MEDRCPTSMSRGPHQERLTWPGKGNVSMGLRAPSSQVTGMNANSLSLLPKPQRRKTLSQKEANAMPPST